MIHRVTRTYIAATIFIVVFLYTFQLLRYSGSSDSSAAAQSSTSWKEWMWPTYSGGVQQGDAVKSKPSKTSRPGKAPDSYSGEQTVQPVYVTVTVTAKTTEATDSPSYKAWKMKPLVATNTTFTIPKDMVHKAEGPKPHEIVMLTAADGKGHNGGIKDILGKTAQNRKEYCEHHGYNYHFVNISKFDVGDAHPVWKKIPAIVEAFNAFPKAKWVWFLDLDAIIMTPKQGLVDLVLSHEGMKKSINWGGPWTAAARSPLGTIMPNDADLDNLDMLIAQDHNGVNAGSIFLRRSKYTQWLLDMWADPFFMQMDWPGKEQDALLHFINHHRIIREHTGMLKQRVVNPFVEGGPTMQWQKGDLLVHLAGCWVPDKCGERWKEFWDKRESL
ncbi:hypothetical protein EG328_009711 [Venturia inaequalis]|uniref:Glycosyltransferase family 34 protein n=1 Tax=Venturia inaequalis TaxID=5025 RepID=A0A8H3VKF8_VENIN|nr:hypothetical protein EG328_009711 [Venturia inaequalis]